MEERVLVTGSRAKKKVFLYKSIRMTTEQQGQYALVNGIKMYYEIHGSGQPLVLIHGAASTIESNFGRILPALASRHRVIAVELQGHGHTADRDAPFLFTQDADDVAALLQQLNIKKADIFGFSNGGTTSIYLALRHPQLVNRLVLASTTSRRSGMQPAFWEGMMAHPTIDGMPEGLKDAFRKANPDPQALQNLFDKCVVRMQTFTDISNDDLRSIQAPALIILGDAEVVRAEHAVEMARTLPHAKLAIIPGEHGAYIGEACSAIEGSRVPELAVELIEEFLADGPANL